MEDVATARFYILGFLSALKQIKSEKFDSYNKKWETIDSIENDYDRHIKTIEYYKALSFVDGKMY